MGYPDCCSNQLVWGPNVESDSGFFLMFGVCRLRQCCCLCHWVDASID
jgi:hypothetical protein